MDKAKAKSEYTAHILNIPPTTIADIVLGTLDSSVTECIEVLGNSMVQSNLAKEISEEELVKGIAQLTARFVKKMEPISCKLERYLLENVLEVPDHVLLPEDAAQRTKYSTKTHKKLLKEIESVKNEFKAEKYTTAILQGKQKEAEETLANLKAEASRIEATSIQIFQAKNLSDIEGNSAFIRTKVETFKSQLAELNELVPPSDENANNKESACYKEELLAKKLGLRPFS